MGNKLFRVLKVKRVTCDLILGNISRGFLETDTSLTVKSAHQEKKGNNIKMYSFLSQPSSQTQRLCRRASGTGFLRKWRRTGTLWAGHWTCCLQTSSLPACLGGEGSRRVGEGAGRRGNQSGLEGMGGWNEVDWVMSTTTG